MKTFIQFLFVGCICAICLGVTMMLRSSDIDAHTIFNALFSEYKRFKVPAKVYTGDQNNIFGQTQQMVPDPAQPPVAVLAQIPDKQEQKELPDTDKSSAPQNTQPQPLPYNPQTYENYTGDDFKELISGLEHIASMAKDKFSAGGGDIKTALPTQVYRPKDAAEKITWIAPPVGFMTADTFNYLIYREKQPVTQTIKSVLDTIHGNLMLDLTPFTILIKPNKILVMLFNAHQSYMDFTKRPAWSGASSDLKTDTMYIIEQTGYYPLAVHELTHLYFDGYFLPTISPLWLSEGMAVYMQIYATKQTPDWVNRSLGRILEEGELIPFEEMTSVEDLKDYSDDQAALWYTQAYSIVDYLLNNRSRDEFYRFCNELKANTPLHQALFRAYGMPFNKVSVLQNVWLHDLQKQYQQNIYAPRTLPLTTQQIQANQQSVQNPPEITSDVADDENEPDESQLPAQPQRTKINRLQMVPTNGYKGGF